MSTLLHFKSNISLITMPETFTYYGLQRRLEAAIPHRMQFRLETYNINARLEGANDRIRALRGKAKKDLRKARPELFRPQPDRTFISETQVPWQVLNNITLQGGWIQSYGKRIGTPTGAGW